MPARITGSRWHDDTGTLEIAYRYDSGALGFRLEPAASGRVTLHEAASILHVSVLKLYRMRSGKRLRTVKRNGVAWVRVRELRRLQGVLRAAQ
jgi:hypothetical protein